MTHERLDPLAPAVTARAHVRSTFFSPQWSMHGVWYQYGRLDLVNWYWDPIRGRLRALRGLIAHASREIITPARQEALKTQGLLASC